MNDKHHADLSALLEAEHSKNQAVSIANLALQEPLILKALVDLSLGMDPIYAPRATWALNVVAEDSKLSLAPYISQIIKQLPTISNTSCQRNLMRLFTILPLPSEVELGTLLNTAFLWLEDMSSPIAVKVHSMQVIYQIGLKERDVLKELAVILNDLSEKGSTGEKNRSQKILEKIKKLENQKI